MYADTAKQFAIEHGLTDGDGVNFSAEIINQLVGHLNGLGIETHGSKDMEEDLRRREDDDAIFAVDYVPLTDDEKEDVFSYLDDEHAGRGIVIGDKNIYLVDHAGNEVKRGKGGIPYGFQCVFKVAIDGLSSEQIQKVAKLIKDGRFKNQGSVDLWVKANLDQSGRHSSDSIDAEVRGSKEDHDRLDLEAQAGEPIGGLRDSDSKENSGKGRLVKTGGDGTNFPRVIEVEDQRFITPQGQVYGYATPEGAIYLDERVIKKSRTCIRDFFIKACPPGQPNCLL